MCAGQYLNMKDFRDYVSTAYAIPTSILITDGSSSLDVRQWCDRVDDFQLFFENTGMELRYDGLVTFERETRLWRMCRYEELFGWVWQEVSSPFSIQILSSNGNIFFNGQTNTTFTAKVYRGKEDVTADFPMSAFRWTRSSEDTAADAIWNAQYESFHSNILVITSGDVEKRATFNCHVTISD